MIESSQPANKDDERHVGLTATQLNVGFLAVVVIAVTAVCAWLFLFGGMDSLSGGSDTSVQPVDDTLREISNAELGKMALRPDQLPQDYAAFAAGADNGPLTLDKNANQAFDPAQRRADLEHFGWVAGYDAAYNDPQAAAGKVVMVDAQLDLFQTADEATGFFGKAIAEVTQNVGKTKESITATHAELFDATVANRAAGYRWDFGMQRNDGSRLDRSQIGVGFRRGRLIGSVAVVGFGLSEAERAALEGLVKDLARKLNDQIAQVLAGATARRNLDGLTAHRAELAELR